jgi:hypothetical protein
MVQPELARKRSFLNGHVRDVRNASLFIVRGEILKTASSIFPSSIRFRVFA